VSSGTNLRLANKEPASYFPEITRRQGTDALEMQAVPADPGLHHLSAFLQFLDARRKLLAGQINAFLEEARAGGAAERPLDVAEVIQQGESKTVEFKGSLQWDTKEARPNPALRMSVLDDRRLSEFRWRDTAHWRGPQRGHIGPHPRLAPDKESRDEFEQTLVNLIVRYLGAASAGLARIGFSDVDDKLVCIVQVRPAPSPVYMEDGAARTLYIRAGNTSRALDARDAVEYVKAHWKNR
jgi:hypothetical protein